MGLPALTRSFKSTILYRQIGGNQQPNTQNPQIEVKPTTSPLLSSPISLSLIFPLRDPPPTKYNAQQKAKLKLKEEKNKSTYDRSGLRDSTELPHSGGSFFSCFKVKPVY
jgi:hypothetical protein